MSGFAGHRLLDPVGQQDRTELLARAAALGRFPQALLFHGPFGVGKRALALWAGALLLCEQPGERDGPCGECRTCRLCSRLEHPDLHLHFPLPRPRSGPRAKMRERLEQERGNRLAALRDGEGELAEEGEVSGIYLAAVEEIRAQAARRPAVARRAVFVVLDADRMVSQSASPEAANAFLKLLEEPPEYAHVVLTSSRPAALLPTIRSRVTALRVPPLAETDLATYLVGQHGLDAPAAKRLARRARGAPRRAATLAAQDAPEGLSGVLLAAAYLGDAAARFRAAARFDSHGARSVMASTLDDVEERLRDLLCMSLGADAQVADPGTAERARGRVRLPPEALRRSLDRVQNARLAAERNLNPQATIAVLLAQMAQDVREAVEPGGGAAPP